MISNNDGIINVWRVKYKMKTIDENYRMGNKAPYLYLGVLCFFALFSEFNYELVLDMLSTFIWYYAEVKAYYVIIKKYLKRMSN